MRFSIKLLIVLILPLLMASSVHKFYVSVTKIEYKEDQKSLQLISRIFVDDIERLLRERYDETIALDKDKDQKLIDTYLEKYFVDKLNIKLNGKDVSYTFLGKEYENDILFCYIEVANVEQIKTLEISNKILFDLFEEQQNIIRTKIYSKNKSFILVVNEDKGVLKFD